ncbi:TetR/AcrR family transcriptional regulator [Streptomyces sp. NPDC087294]|uniref:TetR/AcrR family transcriptional regulator n=1 Tax=Streptomyces sp. NPDC087294 TaxID=3365777 RepID=UPI003815C1EF
MTESTHETGRGGRTGVRSARGARSREEIVDAAYTLFARHGYRGARMAEVAKAVGMTEPALIYHFGNKLGLLKAVVERRNQLSEAAGRRLVELGGLAALSELPAIAAHYSRQPDLIKLFYVLMAENLDQGSPAHEFFVDRYRTLRADIAELIAIGQRRGEIRPDVDPGLKAVEILGILDGISGQWLLDPDAADYLAAIESYGKSLLRDLTTEPPAEGSAG